MRIVIAPDSFKGSLSAARAAEIAASAARAVFPGAEAIQKPVADGGEGTAEALVAASGGAFQEVWVAGPLGGRVRAKLGVLPDGTAVVELAQAAGLPLVPENRRDPLRATTRGVGEMIGFALTGGASRLLVGIGGSATNDGGTGLLRALGARFLTSSGAEITEGGIGLAELDRIDLSCLSARLRGARIDVLCDVTNPLTGPEGATCVYGPQKGATPEMIDALERGMSNYRHVLMETLGRDVGGIASAGAAGGVGAALIGVLGATPRRGIDTVLEAIRFDSALEGAALCVTGEGRLDGQSVAFGKAIGEIARRCGARGIPVAALVGGFDPNASAIYALAEASILPIVNAPMTLKSAMERAPELLYDAAERMYRFIKMRA